jgi:hypothetical protein
MLYKIQSHTSPKTLLCHDFLLALKLTEGKIADYTQAIDLIHGLSALALMADRAYDTNAILEWLEEHDIEAVIRLNTQHIRRCTSCHF